MVYSRCDHPAPAHRVELRRLTSLLLLLTMLLGAGVLRAAGADRIRVALVSGAPTYNSDAILAKAQRHLEALYPFDCTLIAANPTGEGFDRMERLLDADVALFFVRRRTPPAETLAIVRKFVDSGKGIVAVGPSSHAWQEWPTFDVDVLGAKYGGPYAEGKGVTDLRLRPHAILTGGEDFTTD
ncbi:MAG: hypothetical protein RIQ93_2668, partial [Verrucomicrobiota bacterium]